METTTDPLIGTLALIGYFVVFVSLLVLFFKLWDWWRNG